VGASLALPLSLGYTSVVADLETGTVLGGCRLDEVVGKGGMGVVYRARQLDLDRDVALKVISPELVEDSRTRARFLSEARAAGAVEHPNVVPVHGVGIADGRAYLVMRYVAGEDLRARVRRDGALAPAQAAGIAVQLGDALDAIHRAGYVHRDVKPQNVMLDRAGHVYLLDFGLAKHALATAGPTRSDQWVGTLDYVAPEQIRGRPADARADVYALGGVLYFMLTGRVPFERDDDEAKLWAHLADDPPRPSAVRPDLPRELDAVVQRALAKDPDRRYPSAGDLGRAARAAAGGGGDTSRERMVARGAAAPRGSAATTVTTRRAPRVGRRAAAVTGAALAAVAAAAGAAVLLGSDGDGGSRRTATPSPAAAENPLPPAPRVGAVIKGVGNRPRDIAVAGGDLWVASFTQPRLTRIDADTRRRHGAQPAIGRGAAAVAAEGKAVWAAIPSRREVVRLDAASGAIGRRVATPHAPIRLAAGPTGLWIVGRDAPDPTDWLMRYDREGTRLLWEIPIQEGISAIALGRGVAWVALRDQGRIRRIDVAGAFRNAGFLLEPASELTYGAGYLWASVPADDSVARIDPVTTQGRTIDVAGHPAGLAAAGGRVFVASHTRNEVVVIDAKRAEKVGEPIPVEVNPWAVTAGGGRVWVTGLGENSVTRIDY
jgi:YVTN family beta-propeller protein